MDISQFATELADALREQGWHIDAEQHKCKNKDCHNSESHNTAKTYCPYCGEEMEVSTGGAEDIEEALRSIDAVGGSGQEGDDLSITVPQD